MKWPIASSSCCLVALLLPTTGPVNPSFRALTGRRMLTVRRHMSNTDSLSFHTPTSACIGKDSVLIGARDNVRGERQTTSYQPFDCSEYTHPQTHTLTLSISRPLCLPESEGLDIHERRQRRAGVHPFSLSLHVAHTHTPSLSLALSLSLSLFLSLPCIHTHTQTHAQTHTHTHTNTPSLYLTPPFSTRVRGP